MRQTDTHPLTHTHTHKQRFHSSRRSRGKCESRGRRDGAPPPATTVVPRPGGRSGCCCTLATTFAYDNTASDNGNVCGVVHMACRVQETRVGCVEGSGSDGAKVHNICPSAGVHGFGLLLQISRLGNGLQFKFEKKTQNVNLIESK